MKRENLFTYDLDDEESIIEKDAFVIRRESPELAAKSNKLIEASVKKMVNGMGKQALLAALPPILALVGCVLLYFAVGDYGTTGAISVLPACLALVAFAFTAYTFVLSRRAKKKDEESTDATLDAMGEDLDAYRKELRAELSIPSDTKELELFTVAYSTEDGESGEDCFSTVSTDAFWEDESLCFLFSGGVIAVPRSEIEGVFRVDAPVTFDSWMKEDAEYDEGVYAPYGITKTETDDEERYEMQGFYSLRFTHGDTPFEVVIPLYEEKTLHALGLTPREEN